MSTQDSLTPLEREIYEGVRSANAGIGLCPSSMIRVQSRESTGGGRLTSLASIGECLAVVDCGIFSYPKVISLPGLSIGVGGSVTVKDRQATMIEIFVYGSDHWSGDESGFAPVTA